jgi:hypothetical protein
MRTVCSERRYARPTAQRLAQARPQIESGALQLHGGRLYRPEDAPYADEAVDQLTIHTEVLTDPRAARALLTPRIA